MIGVVPNGLSGLPRGRPGSHGAFAFLGGGDAPGAHEDSNAAPVHLLRERLRKGNRPPLRMRFEGAETNCGGGPP